MDIIESFHRGLALNRTDQAALYKKMSHNQKVAEFEISKLRLENQILKK